MRKNTVTSKNRSPQNLTRFPNSRPKYTQTWHHVLKRPQPCINQIKYLHSQQPFYCSSWVWIFWIGDAPLPFRRSSRERGGTGFWVEGKGWNSGTSRPAAQVTSRGIRPSAKRKIF